MVDLRDVFLDTSDLGGCKLAGESKGPDGGTEDLRRFWLAGKKLLRHGILQSAKFEFKQTRSLTFLTPSMDDGLTTFPAQCQYLQVGQMVGGEENCLGTDFLRLTHY